jgi:hypothetical protein
MTVTRMTSPLLAPVCQCHIVHTPSSHVCEADKYPSDVPVTPETDDHEDPPPWASAVTEDLPTGPQRRKVKGYCIGSEEERSGESDYYPSDGEVEDTKACNPWETSMPYGDESWTIHSDSLEISTYTHSPPVISTILPYLLPLTYVTDNVSVSSGTSFASNAFETLTYHRELREAQVDSDFDRILTRLLSEWYYTGASVNVFHSPCKECALTFHSSFFPSRRRYPHQVCLSFYMS